MSPRAFNEHNSAVLLVKAYKTYVRPLLEYSIVVWNPYCMGDINSIESVQRYFTYKVFIKCNIPYNANTRYGDGLSMLCLERLELRRLYFDLIEIFKCVKGFSNVKIYII